MLVDYTLNPMSLLSGPAEGASLITFGALDILNKRHEFGTMVDTILYNSLDSYYSARSTYLQTRINEPPEPMEDNLDLFSILNDPSALIEMKKDEWLVKGKPDAIVPGTKGGKTTGGGKGRNTYKRMKETYARHEQSNFEFDKYDRRTGLKVKVYPEFNWGPYEVRTKEGK